jgi:hypothetical protein
VRKKCLLVVRKRTHFERLDGNLLYKYRRFATEVDREREKGEMEKRALWLGLRLAAEEIDRKNRKDPMVRIVRYRLWFQISHQQIF